MSDYVNPTPAPAPAEHDAGLSADSVFHEDLSDAETYAEEFKAWTSEFLLHMWNEVHSKDARFNTVPPPPVKPADVD